MNTTTEKLSLKSRARALTASPHFLAIGSALICALIGIAVGYVILLIISPQNATKAIVTILKNFFYYKKTALRLYYLGQTLVKTVPLVLCALSVLFAYKSGLFNIGVGGQYCISIGISLWCALNWHLPWWQCVCLATLAAAAWGALAGLFKAFFNVNEVIACIMLNWIALYLTNILMAKESVMDSTKSETFHIRAVSSGSPFP